MTILTRILLATTIIFGSASIYFVRRELQETKGRVREATEEPLVDMVYSLAQLAAGTVTRDGGLDPSLFLALRSKEPTPFVARIYDVVKTSIDVRILLLDQKGDLLFDSQDRDALGTSFAQWRDVVLALRGEYGARTTHPDGAACSSMFLSAPIWALHNVQGVVTVVKPNCLGNALISKTKSQIIMGASLVFTGAGLAAIIATVIITRPLRRLTLWVRALRDGKPASIPLLPPGELHDLGTTIAELRTALDSAHRIDRYARTISHELKSPITAIRGSVEVLREATDSDTRDHFLTNIERETTRMHNLIESLVTLNSLPLAADLCSGETLSTYEVVAESIQELRPLAESRGVQVTNSVASQILVVGNRFWLSEVLRNVIRNAIEFAPPEIGVVTVSLSTQHDTLVCRIVDNGPGIPDWALPKIFDQFFSLPRPNEKRRSSGLGLSIAREVVARMQGTITLQNGVSGGAEVELRLPRAGS